MLYTEQKELDMIIPVCLEGNEINRQSIVSDILEQKEKYGFTKFILTGPSTGWRSIGYPPRDYYENLAELFLEIKKELTAHDITLGWWCGLTIKSGVTPEFTRMIKADGTEAPFSSCPADPNFRNRFASDVARFARIAKPAFICFEDDYGIAASVSVGGCFCKHHLEEFAKRQGRMYTREELVEIFSKETDDAFAIERAWRQLRRDTLVNFSEAIRKEVDKESPEVPMGLNQPGGADVDGDCTESIIQALAGDKHMPFTRLCGTFYCGGETKAIPDIMYHSLYSKQHMKIKFNAYHESDTFPHTRFYSSAAQMRAMMATAYSSGFMGSIFHTQQHLDDPNEETAYGKMFMEEQAKFTEAYRISSMCERTGAEICYDPFWNTADMSKSMRRPLWTRCVSLFGIPYTSLSSPVAFWDERQAKYADDATVREYLSKGLFLDGDAAKRLVLRGYGKYIGVELGEDIAEGKLKFDLGAREHITEKFMEYSRGKTMQTAHIYAVGRNGKLLKMTVTDPKCEIVTNAYTFQGNLITPAMTRFENELGGRVVVMGMTLENNQSQSLYNYRRQHLFHALLEWCGDVCVYAKNAPNISVITNEAKDKEASGFRGMITLINLGDDAVENVKLHLPPIFKDAKQFLGMNKEGKWEKLSYAETQDGIMLNQKLEYCRPVYILMI